MPLSVKRVLAVAPVVVAFALVALLPARAVAVDKDCIDFKTQRAAQFFFLRHGGPRHDPDRLDGDHDGVACEDNPCPCYYKKHLPHRRHHRRSVRERLLAGRIAPRPPA